MVYHGTTLCYYGTSMVQITYHAMLSLINIHYAAFTNLPEIWPAEKVWGRFVFMSGTDACSSSASLNALLSKVDVPLLNS